MAAVSRLSPDARKLWFSNVRSRNSPWRWKKTARRSALSGFAFVQPGMAALTQCRVGQPLQREQRTLDAPQCPQEPGREHCLGRLQASLRKMVDGATAPTSMDALTRSSSAQPRTSAAVSTASPMSGFSTG